jgi:hypothetical protein
MFNQSLPDWTVKISGDQLELGAYLATRDGRKHGNAHVIAIKGSILRLGELSYTLLTECGTRMNLTKAEILSAFYPTQRVSDLQVVLERFNHAPSPTKAVIHSCAECGDPVPAREACCDLCVAKLII